MDYTRSSRSKRNGQRLNGNPKGRPNGGHLTDIRAAAESTDSDEADDLLDAIDRQSSGGETTTSVAGIGSAGVATIDDTEISTLDSSHCSLDGRCSGPSSPRAVTRVARGSAPTSPRAVTRVARGSAPQGWCPGCQKVWQKARHMRQPQKDKLLDHDPSSLTCDQWVLKKRWRPRGLRVLKSTLKGSLKLLHRRRGDVVRGQPTCSRAHAFLRRNLRLCAKASGARRGRKRKGAWRTSAKRPRSEPPDPAPADRSHGDSDLWTLDSQSEAGEGVAEAQGPAHVTPDAVPSLVTVETAEEARRPAKRGGFKELLSQLRGNSRAIVKEDVH